MKFLRSLLENQHTAELTQRPSENEVRNAWHEGVLYKGQPIFNLVYESDVDDIMEAKLTQYNTDNGIMGFDAQESYLGYVPSKDMFIMGFDTWGEVEDDYEDYDAEDHTQADQTRQVEDLDNVVAFRLNDAGRPYSITVMHEVPGRMMYPQGHRYLKQTFRDLIDIRLD